MEPASAFGLIKGVFDAIRGVFGVVAPKVELTYEDGKSPYVESDVTTIWQIGPPNELGNTIAEMVPGNRRWFRIGIRNRSIATVDDLRIELASIDPPAIGHLPLELAIMHGARQPLTLHRAKEPTFFADVVLKVDEQDTIHVMSTMMPRAGLPAQRYRLGIRVT